VDQPRPFQPFPPGAEQLVDVAAGLGAALYGQAARLVERQDLFVLVDHQRARIGRLAGVQLTLGAHGRRLRQGRHADLGAGGEAGVGLGAGAVDADLAGAGQFLEVDVVQVRPAALEPAVQAHARLALIHEQGADLPHAKTRRAR
jgi:hypothetical protein